MRDAQGRVGWVLAEPGVLTRLTLAKEAADLCSSSLTQLVAERYLESERWRVNLRHLIVEIAGVLRASARVDQR